MRDQVAEDKRNVPLPRPTLAEVPLSVPEIGGWIEGLNRKY